MSVRLELAEREIGLSQSALDRRDNLFHIWTNDPYWYRRLERVGAILVDTTSSSRTYTVDSRQVLIRRIPAKRIGRPPTGNFFKKRAMLAREDIGLPN